MLLEVEAGEVVTMTERREMMVDEEDGADATPLRALDSGDGDSDEDSGEGSSGDSDDSDDGEEEETEEDDEGEEDDSDDEDDDDEDDDDEDDDDDDDEEEEEEEEELPRLTFYKLGADVPTILNDRVATCFAVSSKFAILGTDLGSIHILDAMNGTEVQRYTQHSERVTDISIDRYGDFVATGADDGKVIIRNLYDAKAVLSFSFDRPIRSVAIDPEYPKKKKNMFITGGKAGQLLLHVDKSFAFFSRTNATVLHSGEGCVSIVRWRGPYVAWANDIGVKLYDTTLNQRIASVDRPQNSPSAEEYQCRLSWKDDKTLLMGWADHIAVGEIRQRAEPAGPGEPNVFMQLLVRIETSFWISGIAPFSAEEMALLAYLDSEVELESGQKALCGDVPELKILTMAALEVSSSDLAVEDYDKFRANDYFFESIPDENVYFIVSPRNIIVGKPLSMDERIEWLIKHDRHEDAVNVADENHALLTAYTPTKVREAWLQSLLEKGMFDHAAALTQPTFNTDVLLWEKWIAIFRKFGALNNLAKYIPRDEPRLKESTYTGVLLTYLDTDLTLFNAILTKWVAVIKIDEIVQAVENKNLKNPSNQLRNILAFLYARTNQKDKSLNIYLDLGRTEAFDLLNQKPLLFQHVKDRVVDMIRLDQERAIALLTENVDQMPVSSVLPQLEHEPVLQLQYLEAMAMKDEAVARKFGHRLVLLTADHARHKLLRLLQTNHAIPYREALKICQEKKLWREYAYCLQRGGKVKEAMVLMITQLGLVEEAIELVAQENDETLWDDLIDQCFASENPEHIRLLLANSGSYINPLKIIQRPDLRGRVIDGLRDSLVKILSDFNLQIDLLKGSTAIMMNDCVDLTMKLHRLRKRAIVTEPAKAHCHNCSRALASFSGTRDEALLFRCKHMFCRTCLQEFVAGRQRSRSMHSNAPQQPIELNFCPICTRSARRPRGGGRGAVGATRPIRR